MRLALIEALAHQTHYVIWEYWPGADKTRLFVAETPHLRTAAEAAREMKHHDNAVCVTRSDYDLAREDGETVEQTSREIAELWWRKLLAEGQTPDDSVPEFISDWLDESERWEHTRLAAE